MFYYRRVVRDFSVHGWSTLTRAFRGCRKTWLRDFMRLTMGCWYLACLTLCKKFVSKILKVATGLSKDITNRESHTLGGDALEGRKEEEHTLTLLVGFFRKVRCVVLATGVRVWLDVWMWTRQEEYVRIRWRSVVFVYPHGKKAWVLVCWYEQLKNA